MTFPNFPTLTFLQVLGVLATSYYSAHAILVALVSQLLFTRRTPLEPGLTSMNAGPSLLSINPRLLCEHF